MYATDVVDYSIARLVDQLFSTHRYGENCRNPVTGEGYVHGEDPVEPQKMRARRALVAREWFAINGPADAQPLPLWHGEREDLKIGGLPHILAWYARSLDYLDYDLLAHPLFDKYASGVMASEFAPDFIKNDRTLQKRFPPRRLKWLDNGLIWNPPCMRDRYWH
jgi:hypothetical protein